MRSLTITLLFSVFSIFTYAQTAFTEKTVLDINKRMVDDPAKSLDDISPDYTLSGSEGQLFTYDQLKKMFAANKHLSWDMTELKTKQYGNIGIATGITKHSLVNIASNAKVSYHVRATYIYEFKNGKWLWLSAHHSGVVPLQTPEEEAAIKRALDDETIAFCTGNKEAMAKMWKDDPKNFFMGSNPDGTLYNFDNETLKKYVSNNLTANGNTAVKSNHRFKFQGNTAIVDFDQITTSKTGEKYVQRNLNVMEKIGGEWKFVGASHHGYNTETAAEDETTIKKFLDEQAVAFHNADKSMLSKFYKDDAKTFHLSSGSDGKFWLRDNETVKKLVGEMKPTGVTPTRSNYQIRVIGNMAIAHYDQENAKKDGTKSLEHNMTVMERIGGNWKIIGTSVHPNNVK